MEFIARLRGEMDQAMMLFNLRRVNATAEFIKPPKGGTDVELRGTVPDEKLDDLIALLAKQPGAVHAGERHVQLPGTEHQTVEEAEAPMGGPFTDPLRTRAAWSFGGDDDDFVAQTLHREGALDVKHLAEVTGLRVELVMKAVQRLAVNQVVRKYRHEGKPESYDLARTVRETLA